MYSDKDLKGENGDIERRNVNKAKPNTSGQRLNPTVLYLICLRFGLD